MLVNKNKINLKELESGLDSLEHCLNKAHFLDYKKPITYEYNSRGFRDHEWPNDLSDVVWCIGDSFTSGIGQPFEETWPKVLENKIKKRCINLGLDGCSNDHIAHMAKEIFATHKPNVIIIMWSYFHRRKDIHFDKEDFGGEKDLSNFIANLNSVNAMPTNVINLLIPHALMKDNNATKLILNKKGINNIITFEQLDYDRDYHHFDVLTSESVTDIITKTMNRLTENSET